MGNINTRINYGTYEYMDKTCTSFIGTELRAPYKRGYVGTGLTFTDNGEKNSVWFDIKGKCNYIKSGLIEQNFRLRTTIGKNDIEGFQVRYSPLTVNAPLGKNVGFYSNLYYKGKHNFDENKWTHMVGNFTGISYDVTKKDNLSLEVEHSDLKNIKNREKDDWSLNLIYTHKL